MRWLTGVLVVGLTACWGDLDAEYARRGAAEGSSGTLGGARATGGSGAGLGSGGTGDGGSTTTPGAGGFAGHAQSGASGMGGGGGVVGATGGSVAKGGTSGATSSGGTAGAPPLPDGSVCTLAPGCTEVACPACASNHCFSGVCTRSCLLDPSSCTKFSSACVGFVTGGSQSWWCVPLCTVSAQCMAPGVTCNHTVDKSQHPVSVCGFWKSLPVGAACTESGQCAQGKCTPQGWCGSTCATSADCGKAICIEGGTCSPDCNNAPGACALFQSGVVCKPAFQIDPMAAPWPVCQ